MNLELDELLAAASELPEQNFEDTPDGTYAGAIESVGFGTTKTEPIRNKFTIETIISGPTYVGKHEWKTYVLDTAENVQRMTTDLVKFGIDCSSMKKITEQLEDMLDVPVELVIKTGKSGYRNLSINPVK